MPNIIRPRTSFIHPFTAFPNCATFSPLIEPLNLEQMCLYSKTNKNKKKIYAKTVRSVARKLIPFGL